MADVWAAHEPIAQLLFFLASASTGPLAVPLGGLAIHHGAMGPLGVILPLWLGLILGSKLLARRHTPQRRPGWLRHVLRASGLVLVLVPIGYALGHLLAGLSPSLRIALGIPSTLAMIFWMVGPRPELREAIEAPPNPSVRRRLGGGGLLCAFVVGAWWHAPQTSPEELVAAYLARHHVTAYPGSLHFIDQPKPGLQRSMTVSRAVLLAAPKDAPPEVFFVKLASSHDGPHTRVVGAYNVSDTAAVSETDLKVWGKFAVWRVEHQDKTLSFEIADFRGALPARGPGWTRIARIQRAITDRQEVGQARGIGRTSLRFAQPPTDVSFEVPAGRLVISANSRQLELELGRAQLSGDRDSGASLTVHERARPGDLTTWAVDRVRALPFIGSDRMQWVKGVAQRAAEELESIEEEVVGIDADEAIAEELGSLLSHLPIAKRGPVPGWPPPPLEPIFSPALPGEGQWVSLAQDALVAAPGETTSPFLFTFIRADRKRRYAQISLTLWDARRLSLNMAAGTREPKSTTGELGTGLIPRDPEVLERLAAAFNGAFQAVHGEFGMVVDRRVLLPPKPYAATVAKLEDGTTAMGTWPLETEIPNGVVSLRQNMTPLLVDDTINPYERHWWGGVPEGWTTETRTVRSGLCMTKEHFGIYLYSASTDPYTLAEAMRLARCIYGIHLDMNAGHTGLEFYRVARKGKLPVLDRPLDSMWEARGVVSGASGWEFSTRLMVRKMPLMDFPRYIHLTSRDFFYLTRRHLLPGPRLPALDPDHPDEGAWRVQMPGNPWPHSLAATVLSVPSDQKSAVPVTLVMIDPKTSALSKPSDGALATLDLTADAGADVPVWLGPGGFGMGQSPAGQTVIRVGRGTEEPDAHTTVGLCIRPGHLLLIGIAPKGRSSASALAKALAYAGCENTAYFGKGAAVGIQALGLDVRSDLSDAAVSLVRRPYRGMERLFPDTPVVPPSKWAIPQRRRVEYVPKAN